MVNARSLGDWEDLWVREECMFVCVLRCGSLNPEPCACQANALLLSYIPSPGIIASIWKTADGLRSICKYDTLHVWLHVHFHEQEHVNIMCAYVQDCFVYWWHNTWLHTYSCNQVGGWVRAGMYVYMRMTACIYVRIMHDCMYVRMYVCVINQVGRWWA